MGSARFPFSVPNSWYLVAFSDELAPGDVRALRYLDRHLVLFRGESGAPFVLDAYCPHLGAHMGVGGAVVGDTLRCPFHAWRWEGGGRCVEVPYASRIPAQARTKSYPVEERHGMIFVWYHADASAPEFAIPEIDEWGGAEWSDRWLRWEWTVRTHPQEMAENGIDWPHFATIHQMEIPEDHGWDFHAHSFTWQVGGSKPVSSLGGADDQLVMYGENWGLGYNWLRQAGHYDTIVATGLTPIDGETTHVRMGVIGRVGANATQQTLDAFEAYMNEHAVFAEQDFPIWENKKFRPAPPLCDGDGPIAEYRRWAARFYSADAVDSTD